MLKMSPRSKMESPTCDYEKKTKTEKGHFKTLALSGQCNNKACVKSCDICIYTIIRVHSAFSLVASCVLLKYTRTDDVN